MKHPLVTIIILNWNGWEDTIECLESVYQINYPNYQIILVDNHSQDQSLQKIKEYTQGKIQPKTNHLTYNPHNKPLPLTTYTHPHTPQQTPPPNHLILIKNQKNYGFAKGNNIAIQYALQNLKPDYILLLNNDTIVKPNFLEEMVQVATSDDKVGIVGGKLLNAYNPQIIDSTGHVIRWGRMVDRGHNEVDRGQYDNQTEIVGAMAAAVLYSREMLEDIGLFDTEYITLGEDADLSWRAYRNGWKARYAPKAIIYHKRGRSITRKSVLPHMTILSTKNTTTYVARYGTAVHKFLYLFSLFKEGCFVLVGSLIGRNEVNAKKYFKVLIESYATLFKSIFNP